MTDADPTILYLGDDDLDDLTVVLDAADLLDEEQRAVGYADDELANAVSNISVLAGIDMKEVRRKREEEEEGIR